MKKMILAASLSFKRLSAANTSNVITSAHYNAMNARDTNGSNSYGTDTRKVFGELKRGLS
jgi:hypothetical protein